MNNWSEIIKMPEHPYIPNSVQKIKKEMLNEIGVESVEELFATITQNIRIKRKARNT